MRWYIERLSVVGWSGIFNDVAMFPWRSRDAPDKTNCFRLVLMFHPLTPQTRIHNNETVLNSSGRLSVFEAQCRRIKHVFF